MALEIFKTEDGSDSIYNPALAEVYHSKHGAINESIHVFIKAGLEYLSDRFKTIKILEVGFGTGLNALLTIEYSYFNKIAVEYFTLEPFPINKEVYSKLNYPDLCKIPDTQGLFNKLHQSAWKEKISINKNFLFIKSTKGIEEEELNSDNHHLVYFDAFAMDIQPEMWSQKIFDKIYQSMVRNGVLVTYAAKGQIRRNLQAVGFRVERIPGPKGKREMLRATKE